MNPIFAYPSKFAEISGLSAKEIRCLCQQQAIPNERTKRGFRINVKGALAALEARTENFTGHTYKSSMPISILRPARPKKSKAETFGDKLSSLRSLCEGG